MFTQKFFIHSAALILVGLLSVAGVTVRAASATVVAGRAFTLTPTVAGTAPFTYQWYKGGAAMSGATASSYQVSNTQAINAGAYTVVIANAAGSTTSDTATIILAAAPAITTQPASQTVAAGNSVVFTAAAGGLPAPTFQWKLNGTNVSGATSATLTVANVQSANAGTYTVVATNVAGSVTSSGAILTVNAGTVAPVFTTQPVSQTAIAGNAVTFTSLANGSPAPSYQWRKNGTAISGATGSSYTIASATSAAAATYTVVATNSAGSVTSNSAVLTVNVAPVITSQPVSQTVTAGGAVTFTAAATGSPAPTFQWKRNGTNISGATSATLAVANVQSANAGTYTVVATNIAGTATSSGAILTVNAGTSAPAITTQPTSKTVTAGASTTFTVAASGSPAPAFQWRKNGAAISGATATAYSIASVATGDAGTYTVVATNSAGSVTSTGAVLTVNAANTAPTLSNIANQNTVAGAAPSPIGFTIGDGETAASSLTVSGSSSNLTLVPNANLSFGGSGANRTVSITPVAGQTGTATITVTVSDGTTSTSGTFLLIVNVAPPAVTAYVAIEAEAGVLVSPMVAASDANASGGLTVVATGSNAGMLTVPVTISVAGTYVIWCRVLSPDDETDSFFVSVDGGTEQIFHTASGKWAPTWQWSAVTGLAAGLDPMLAAGLAPRTFQLGVGSHNVVFRGREAGTALDRILVTNDPNFNPAVNTAPTISDIPNQSINAGAGTGLLAFTVNDAEIAASSLTLNGSSSNTALVPNSAIVFGGSGANRTVSVTPAAGQTGTATISVTTSDALLTTTDIFVLTVNATQIAPVITTQPVSKTVTAGSSVTFSVAASGVPAPAYQWRMNGTNISGATSATLTIANVQAAAAGTYTAVATNSAGSATSSGAALTVNPAASVPVFTTQPASRTVTAGNSVTFTVAASGSPTPSFQWKRNGTNVSGATSATLNISNVQSANAGTYTVVATNSAGSVTSTGAILTVNAAATAPAFTTQPLSKTVTVGTSVTFTAAANGTPAPTYQWRKNGVAISGATGAAYTIASVASGDAGTFSVVASNVVGAATSNGAALTVNAATSAPTITTQPIGQTSSIGSSVTFSVAANGSPTLTYQWRKNGSRIRKATGTSYSLAGISSSDAGTYTVVVTNTYGSVTSSGAVLTVSNAPAFSTQPTSQAAVLGASVTFAAAASGLPAPSYQWRKNGVAISGATGAACTIASVKTTDAGSYSVVATNSAGAVTSNSAILTVNSAPVITTQPYSQTVIAGTTVTFSIAAGGSPAPTYQWRKNGVAITGATGSTYQLVAVATTDAGTYTVTATNSVGTVTSNGALLAVNPASSPIVYRLDYNADGNSDILFQNLATGDWRTWLMSGTTGFSMVTFAQQPLTARLCGGGDFNADGKSDVLWQDSVTGDCGVWLMSDQVVASKISLGTLALVWQMRGAGDFNADGMSDILWQNTATGECRIWLMAGTTLSSIVSPGQATATLMLTGTGDFNKDGQSDILWQDSVSGDYGVWLMSGASVSSSVTLGTVTLDWQMSGAGDFNADTNSDILWQNLITGEGRMWLMVGTTATSDLHLFTITTDLVMRN